MSLWVLLITLILLLHTANSVDEAEKQSLLDFYQHLSNGSPPSDPSFGWTASSDPCFGSWKGVACDSRNSSIKKVALEGLSLSGILNASSICNLNSLKVLSIQNNNIQGQIPQELSSCKGLTHLFLSNNKFSGSLPPSLSRLINLKRLFFSNNNFSGELPDFPRISGLITFLCEKNQFNGSIPNFDFTNLQQFNASFNDFSGPIPDVHNRFQISSFMGNPGLCGTPMPQACPPTPTKKVRSKKPLIERILMFLGYFLLGFVFIGFIAYKILKRKKKDKSESNGNESRNGATPESKAKASSDNSSYKTGGSRSEYSLPSSSGSPTLASALVILSSSKMRGMSFEQLLKSPAELLGRGRYGSLYKVVFEDGDALAVKRIKDWTISIEDFRRRMEKIDKAKHLNVLPVLAFYCSQQEKLVVYEYQPNGSLFNLLHHTRSGQTFDWGSRLGVASSLSEGLAFMHIELLREGISHGNLKSSNILINDNLEPCISEYGLMLIDSQATSSVSHSKNHGAVGPSPGGQNSQFESDVYNFGVILLELLTGKLVQNNGFDLANWVHSVVREEWTVEVFDKALIAEGASEERMVNLLQVALRCIDPSQEARPSAQRVASMINSIKEEEESVFKEERNENKIMLA
ncbi:hypothetical protein ACLOJK_035350 [Asimina triloba]